MTEHISTTRRLLTASIALGSVFGAPAFAADPIKIVVPYPPGGPLDVVARALAEELKKSQGSVIVENRPGAAGARGMQAVKDAKADCRTMVMGAVATLATNPALFEKMPYKPDDFAPVSLLCFCPNVLVMAPKRMKELGVKDAKDLIAYIKANPGKLNFASGGNGSAGHIAGAVMVNAGLKMEHIPFKCAAPARLSVIAGETDFIMDNFGSCRASIADGSLIPLAVTTSEPFEHLPGVPTLTSLGYTMDISTWFGLMAPKATPNAKVQAQYDAIFEAMSNPKLREQLDKAGGGVRFLGPNKFGELIAAEQKRYRDMIQSTGIKVQ